MAAAAVVVVVDIAVDAAAAAVSIVAAVVDVDTIAVVDKTAAVVEWAEEPAAVAESAPVEAAAMNFASDSGFEVPGRRKLPYLQFQEYPLSPPVLMHLLGLLIPANATELAAVVAVADSHSWIVEFPPAVAAAYMAVVVAAVGRSLGHQGMDWEQLMRTVAVAADGAGVVAVGDFVVEYHKTNYWEAAVRQKTVVVEEEQPVAVAVARNYC